MGARLGVNIDHVATLRQLRGTKYPDLIEAARLAVRGGADQITVHLREDRRHIQDGDVRGLRRALGKDIPALLNLEMAMAEPVVRFAVKIRPDWACLVPEKRQEVTTEGGLDLRKYKLRAARVVARLRKAGIRVSLFVEPTAEAAQLSAELEADAVELHTGRYALRGGRVEALRIEKSAREACALGLHVHAGHGLEYENTRALAAFEREGREPLIEEFNIGHAIVCRAALVGLERATREMAAAIHAP